MGLLDDAIREHLDLKRRQGADPGEIARKEREALEPVIPDEPATWGEEPSPALEAPLEGWEDPPPVAAEQPDSEEALPSAERQQEVSAPEANAYVPAVDFSTVGQETMEFDMSELLAGGEHSFPDLRPIGEVAAPVRAGRIIQPEPEPEASFEWQVAGHAADEPEPGIPGQERLSFE
jgi:hypothetical protein